MIIKTIPKGSNYLQFVNRFVATFNVPTLGKYNFATAANTGQVILDLSEYSVYLIQNINFSATVPEGDFLTAINTVPTATIKRQVDGQVIYQKPLPLVSYLKSNEAIAYVWSKRKGDRLIVDFAGLLNQPAPLVGLASVTAQLQLDIYQITDENWLQAFRTNTRPLQQDSVFI